LFGDLPDLLVESGTFTDFFWSQNESLVLVSDGIMTWHGNLLWTGDGIIPSSCQYLSLDLHSCWVNSCEIPKLIQITSRFFGLPVYPLYKLWSHCSYFRIWFYQVFPLGGWTHQLLFAHQLDFPIWTREKLISATIHTYIYIYNQYHCIYIYIPGSSNAQELLSVSPVSHFCMWSPKKSGMWPSFCANGCFGIFHW
jgi:hypothetical protein